MTRPDDLVVTALVGPKAACPCTCTLPLEPREADIWKRARSQVWLSLLPAVAGLVLLGYLATKSGPASVPLIGLGAAFLLAGIAAGGNVEGRRDGVIRETHKAAEAPRKTPRARMKAIAAGRNSSLRNASQRKSHARHVVT